MLAQRPDSTMTEIADACDLGRATLYRHFSSREELVAAIQEQALDAAADALTAADLERGPAPEALRRGIAALVGVGDRYRLLAHHAALDPSLLQRRPAVVSGLLDLVARGRTNGEFRTDQPAAWIVASLASLLVLALREMAADRVEPDEAAARVAETLLGGIAADRG